MYAPSARHTSSLPETAALQHALFAMTGLTTPAAPRRLFNALFPPPDACAAIDAER